MTTIMPLWPQLNYNNGPISQIQPFTYQDDVTYLDILYLLRDYIRDIVVPQLNGLSKEVDEAIAALISHVNDVLAEQDQKITDQLAEQDQKITDQLAEQDQKITDQLAAQNSTVDNKISELVNYVNEQVQLIIEDAIQVQDPVVAGMLGDAASASRIALDGIVSDYWYSTNVAYVSPTGNDSKSGTAPGKAYATLAHAISAGAKLIYLLPGMHSVTNKIDIPDNVRIIGSGKSNTIVNANVNDTSAFVLNDAVILSDFTIDGAGSSDTTRGIKITGTKGRQVLSDIIIQNFYLACISFSTQAGSQFRAVNVSASCRDSLTTSGRYAIEVDADIAPTGAVPRSFVNLQTQGTPAINFGGCDNFYVSNSTMGDLRYSSNSRGVNVIGCRVLNQMVLEVDGHNNSIVACNLNPEVHLMNGTDNITLTGSFNREVFDLSGNGRNSITHFWRQFVPTVTGSTGGTFDLGNGSWLAFYSRSGSRVSLDIRLTIGSTTVLPTGELRFGFPYNKSVGMIQEGGSGRIVSGATAKSIFCQLPADTYFRLYPVDSTAPVTSSNPISLETGVVIGFSLTYNQ